MGTNLPLYFPADGKVTKYAVQKLKPEDIVDTNGAGDAFVGGRSQTNSANSNCGCGSGPNFKALLTGNQTIAEKFASSNGRQVSVPFSMLNG